MKLQFVSDQKAHYAITDLCNAMDLSISGYYTWIKRELSLRQVEDKRLLGLNKSIFQSSRETYGSPRIHATLQELGYKIAEKWVARIMQENALVVRPNRAWRCVTTKSDPRYSRSQRTGSGLFRNQREREMVDRCHLHTN